MHGLLDFVASSLEHHALVPGDRRLLVAVSAGVDSMVLLHLLNGLAPRLGLHLVVAHAHHQLRPKAADADETLVRQVATTLGWPVVVGRLEVQRRSEETGESLEMAGRRLRHDFLARTAAQQGIATVALAHHADDQAELVLLRLLRGAGGDGLGGMSRIGPSPSDPGISLIRPLLDLTKDQLRAAAAASGVPFREDRTNRDPRILRNRIRRGLLPLLEHEYAPAIRTLLLRTATIVGDEAEFVSQVAARWLSARRREPFDRLHPAVQRALLRLQLRNLGHEPGFERIESLRGSFQIQEISPGVRIVCGSDGILRRVEGADPPPFQRGHEQIRLGRGGGTAAAGGVRIDYAFKTVRRTPRQFSPGCELFSAAAVGPVAILRHWVPGDRFQPLGLSHPAKLQDLFTNRKISPARRRELVVASTGTGEIFWVEGFPPGEPFKVVPSSRRLLVWKWRSIG